MVIKKQFSGSKKRKLKKISQQFVESQRGALDKFVLKQNPTLSTENLVDENQTIGDINNISEHDDLPNMAKQSIENLGYENLITENINNIREHDELSDMDDDIENFKEEERITPPLDIYDPRLLDNLDNTARDILVEKGPIIELNITFPLDKFSRHFSYASYSRKLSNRESSDRKWLPTT